MPEWWMTITPHDTLDVEQDMAKRMHDEKEAAMFAQLAAQDVLLHPDAANYKLGDNGELLDKDGKEIVVDLAGGGSSTTYTRAPKTGEWLKDGKPLFGRQFKAAGTPEGYVPGEYDGKGSSDLAWVASSKSGLKSAASGATEYGHKDMNWKQPDWMKVRDFAT